MLNLCDKKNTAMWPDHQSTQPHWWAHFKEWRSTPPYQVWSFVKTRVASLRGMLDQMAWDFLSSFYCAVFHSRRYSVVWLKQTVIPAKVCTSLYQLGLAYIQNLHFSTHNWLFQCFFFIQTDTNLVDQSNICMEWNKANMLWCVWIFKIVSGEIFVCVNFTLIAWKW